MFAQGGTDAVAVLDWELSTLGHPFADLAYQCMQWRLGTDAVVPGLAGVDRQSLGIPSEEAYVQQYCKNRRIDAITHWPFYLAFSFFRFAAIVQGVKKRALEGNASSPKAMAYGELTPILSHRLSFAKETPSTLTPVCRYFRSSKILRANCRLPISWCAMPSLYKAVS